MRFCLPTVMRLAIVSAWVIVVGCGPRANTFVEPPSPEVTVSLPQRQMVPEYLDLPGTTTALETVDVRARVQGFLERIDFRDGAKVKAGELLFEIDPRTYQARYDQDDANVAKAKARLTESEAEFGRAKELLPKKAISQSDYDLAQGNRDAAAAAVKLAEANLRAAQLDLDYTQVRTPISGRAGRRLVDVGNLVGASDKTLLTTIVNDDSIYAYANLSESEYLTLSRRYSQRPEKASAPESQRTKALLCLADETGFPHEGWIDFIDNRIDPDTGTLRVRAVFPNASGLLRSGLFVKLRVPLDTHASLLVPATAVLSDQGGRYVLVVGDKDVVEQRPVKVGQTVDHLQVIEEGITAADRVIVNGLQRARPGGKVKPIVAAPAKKAANTLSHNSEST